MKYTDQSQINTLRNSGRITHAEADRARSEMRGETVEVGKHQRVKLVKHHGMIFNAEMVRAILDGRKTQTRRMVKPQPFEDPRWGLSWAPRGIANNKPIYCERNANFNPITKAILVHGNPIRVGDIIWVREAFALSDSGFEDSPNVIYRADHMFGGCNPGDISWKWTPSIHMPRWASRIDLEVTAVRVERVQDISETDCEREGVGEAYLEHLDDCESHHCALAGGPDDCCGSLVSAKMQFKDLWQSIYANWQANPFVWVYEFRRVK